MEDLKEKKCKPCEGGVEPLKPEQIDYIKNGISKGWTVEDNKLLKRNFPFENFKRGMAFAQEVGIIAESENHHPDICISYKYVEISLTTHAIGGLSENDFIMAAKIDEI